MDVQDWPNIHFYRQANTSKTNISFSKKNSFKNSHLHEYNGQLLKQVAHPPAPHRSDVRMPFYLHDRSGFLPAMDTLHMGLHCPQQSFHFVEESSVLFASHNRHLYYCLWMADQPVAVRRNCHDSSQILRPIQIAAETLDGRRYVFFGLYYSKRSVPQSNWVSAGWYSGCGGPAHLTLLKWSLGFQWAVLICLTNQLNVSLERCGPAVVKDYIESVGREAESKRKIKIIVFF